MKQHPVWNTLSHATVIGSCMFIIFFFIDRVNPAMDFLGSDLSKWCLFLYCIASLITGLCSAINLFKRGKAAGKKKHAVHHEPLNDPYPDSALAAQNRVRRPDVPYRTRENDFRDSRFAYERELLHDTRYETAERGLR